MTQSQIRFGHLAYKPFFKYDDKDDPCGLGVDWLRQLLEFSLRGKSVRIKRFDDRGDWSNILDGLIKKDYDVVATPLFATFDRSKRVAFTAPLFFSNVGLYVSRETSSHNAWNDMTADNMTVDKMKSIIERAGKLRFLSVEGEISEKLAAKYSDKGSISSFGSSKTLSSLFETIADSSDPHCALFCESFYAEIQPLVESKNVVNVFPWHQILYPVCFAVRLGDYQLLNLLNIRLIQFTQNGDALRLLEEVAKADYGLNAEDVRKHFVAESPISTDEINTEVQRRA